MTSFSQLAHGRHDERDHRDAVVEPEDAGAIGAVADAMDADVPLATFARGTHAGNCLHQLLEQWDFHEDTAVLVDHSLRRHRLYSTETADAVRHTLAALKTTRLDGLDARLDTAASNKTLSEWEFLLPLGRAGITGQALSDIFARHAVPQTNATTPKIWPACQAKHWRACSPDTSTVWCKPMAAGASWTGRAIT